MLDSNLKEQLTSVFAQIESKISLCYEDNGHEDLPQLLEMLNEVSSTNSHLTVDKSPAASKNSASPVFSLIQNNLPTGIVFKGIPTGHEFTSLVLAILNVDGKGKFPDPILIQRIKHIQGPIHIKTYVSLTCENCPDVVQSLNLMAAIHGNFTHETIVGSYFQDEIDRLSIQGVPSIFSGDTLVHSGRAQILDLISKLEAVYGISTAVSAKDSSAVNLAASVNLDLGHHDVVVIGGGPAGASAAIYSVRKGLKTVLLADKIGGQVQETKGIENLISVIYTEGPQLAAQLAKHVSSYPIQFLENRRVKNIEAKKEATTSDYQIHLESGEFLFSKSIIIATGAKWRELGIPGEKEYLGKGVAFCPHCDGPFYKGKKVAVIGGGNSGVEAAIDLAGIVKEVVLLEYAAELKADKILVDKLLSLSNVSVITSAKTAELLGNGKKLTSLKYLDRKTEGLVDLELDGVFIQIGLVPNSQFAQDIVKTTKFGEIMIDEKNRTSAKGIYAAGDVTTTPYKQIVISIGEGAKAALAAFEDRMLSSI